MPTICPTTDDLSAFATGKLPSEAAEAVADHVESCPSCEATITSCEQSADTLVEQLRTPASEDTGLAELLAKAEALGTPAAEPRPVLKQLRDYQLLEQLGQGGMGTVYRAVHMHLDRTVAVKVLPPERTRDPQAIARFRREMRAIGKLHHPNIVVAHDAGEADGTHFLVMELVEGLDASRIVHQVGPLPVADAAEIVRQAAAGLQHAYEHGLVHRDIKPSNLMLAVGQASSLPKKESGVRSQGSAASPLTPSPQPRDPVVKILDLGLALLEGPQHAGDELTAASQMMGTADYVAPEQAGDSHSVDIRADIYSLGCTLFKLLTGEAPFTGKQYTTAIQKMMAHISAPPPDVRTRRADVPAGLAAVVAKMLAKEPADRYQTPAEAQSALAPFCTGADLAKLARVASGENQPPNAVEHTAPTQPTDATSTFIRREGEAPAKPSDPLDLVTAPRHSAALSHRKHSHPPANLFIRRNILIATATAATLLLAIAAGIVVRIQTAEGTLLLRVDGPVENVKIDGQAAEVITNKDGNYRIAVKPGTHTLVFTGPRGEQFETDGPFTMRPGGEVTITARLLRKKPAVAANTKPTDTSDPDRRAAEYVLSIGGTINVKENGQERMIRSGGNLPQGPFELSGVVLQANSNVTDEVLANFKGCRNLTYLTLCSSQVTDKGLANFQNCKNLRELVLQDTQVTDAGLANFKECKNLDYLGLITAKNVGDAGLSNFQDCNNLTRLNLTQTQVSDAGLAHFQNRKDLVHLFLASTPISDAGLAHFKDFKNLTHLSLGATKVSDAGLVHFQDCKNLQQLILNDTQVSDSSLERLAGYPKLGLLQLRATKVTEAGVKKLAASAPQCKIEWNSGTIEPTIPADPERAVAEWVLGLGGTVQVSPDGSNQNWRAVSKIGDLGAEPFVITTIGFGYGNQVLHEQNFQKLDGLASGRRESLAIYASQTSLSDAAMPHIARLADLTNLYIDGTRVTDDGLRTLRNHPKLRHIHASPHTTDAGLEHLATIPSLGEVTVLRARGIEPQMTAAGITHLKGLQNLNKVAVANVEMKDLTVLSDRRLNVIGVDRATDADLVHLRNWPSLNTFNVENAQGITDAGAQEISRLKDLNTLTLHRSQITSEGLIHLGNLKNLQRLWLWKAKIGDASLSTLADLPKLESLDLRGNEVSDQGVEQLAKLTQIRQLDLRGTRVTQEGMTGLQAALPNCKIEWSPADPERTVAEWVIRNGGSVSFSADGQRESAAQTATTAEELPSTPFVIVALSLGDVQFDNPAELALIGSLPAGKRWDLGVYLGGSNLTDEGLAQIARCPDVTQLSIGRTQVTADGLAAVSKLPKLWHFDAGSAPTDATLAGIAALPSLQRLSMEGAQVTDAGISQLKAAKGITTLQVHSTKVTLPGLAAALGEHDLSLIQVDVSNETELEALKNWPRLQYFHCSNSSAIGDRGIAMLSTLRELATLELQQASISTSGAGQLKSLKNLRQLYLNGGSIGDDAARVLGEMTQLELLALSGSQVTDKGIKELSGLKNLKELGLVNTRVTAEGVKDLQAALPSCKINWSPATTP